MKKLKSYVFPLALMALGILIIVCSRKEKQPAIVADLHLLDEFYGGSLTLDGTLCGTFSAYTDEGVTLQLWTGDQDDPLVLSFNEMSVVSSILSVTIINEHHQVVIIRPSRS